MRLFTHLFLAATCSPTCEFTVKFAKSLTSYKTFNYTSEI